MSNSDSSISSKSYSSAVKGISRDENMYDDYSNGDWFKVGKNNSKEIERNVFDDDEFPPLTAQRDIIPMDDLKAVFNLSLDDSDSSDDNNEVVRIENVTLSSSNLGDLFLSDEESSNDKTESNDSSKVFESNEDSSLSDDNDDESYVDQVDQDDEEDEEIVDDNVDDDGDEQVQDNVDLNITPIDFQPKVLIPKRDFSNNFQEGLGGQCDLDFIRVVVTLTPAFYKYCPNSNDPTQIDDAEEQEELTDEEIEAATALRYKNICDNVLTENFIKLVGTSSQVKGYGASSNYHQVRRKFCVVESDWDKHPYCPREYAGNEYCLIRTPIEIAIPRSYVMPVILAIRQMGHHIDVNANWRTSHLVINDATIANNAPCLRDIFRAIAYCGVTYIAFTSNGQRWPVFDGQDENCGLEGAATYFWNWWEEIQNNPILDSTGCKFFLPIIHSGITVEAGKYPASWTFQRGNQAAAARGAYLIGMYGCTLRAETFPLWNVRDRNTGGLRFTVTNSRNCKEMYGISKITLYVDAGARVSRNYRTVNINWSKGTYPTYIKTWLNRLLTMKVAMQRMIHHIETAGCNHRIELVHIFTFKTDDIHHHLLCDVRKETIYNIQREIVDDILSSTVNSQWLLERTPQDACYNIEEIAYNAYVNIGYLQRESNFDNKKRFTSVFSHDKKVWLDATVAKVLCSSGFSSVNLEKWLRKWEDNPDSYDPDSLNELRFLRPDEMRHDVLDEDVNEEEGNQLIDRFGNPTTRGYNYILMEHTKILLEDEVYQELEELQKRGDTTTQTETQRMKEIRDLCNDKMNELAQQMTLVYRKRLNRIVRLYQPKAMDQLLQDRNNISPLFARFCPARLVLIEHAIPMDDSIINPSTRGIMMLRRGLQQLRQVSMQEQGQPRRIADDTVVIQNVNAEPPVNMPRELEVEDEVNEDQDLIVNDNDSVNTEDIVPYSKEWNERIIDAILSRGDPPATIEGKQLTNEQIVHIQDINWTTTKRKVQDVVRNMLLLSIPGEVTNGEGEWDPQLNSNQTNVVKHRIMKWVGTQYGLQMDPMEPMGQEHNFGVDGLGGNIEDDYLGDGYPERHVPQSEEWWVGLRQCILEKGTDNDGEILSEESIRICSNERWWATFVTLVRFVRIHLCITVGQSIGNNKMKLTNHLADVYDYDQDEDNIQNDMVQDEDNDEDNDEMYEDNDSHENEEERYEEEYEDGDEKEEEEYEEENEEDEEEYEEDEAEIEEDEEEYEEGKEDEDEDEEEEDEDEDDEDEEDEEEDSIDDESSEEAEWTHDDKNGSNEE